MQRTVYCLTWDGNKKRTGNWFTTQAKAQEVYNLKLAQGKNPSVIEPRQYEFLAF